MSDPDRVVVFDDIADLLVPVPPAHHAALHRLLLSLFSVPLNLAAPESQTSTDWAAADTTCLPAVRPAFAWASLLERPVVAPPALPLDADTVFPQPKAHGPLHGIPGARRGDDGEVLLWGTLAADGEQDGSQGNLTADQVEFVRCVGALCGVAPWSASRANALTCERWWVGRTDPRPAGAFSPTPATRHDNLPAR